MNFDSLTRLPVPPLESSISASQQVVLDQMMMFSVAVTLIAALYGLLDWRKTKSPTFLFLLLGGGLAVIFEPFNDILGGCWHPINGQTPVFELMGRPMPMWVILIYFVVYGVQGAVMYRILREPVKARIMWLAFAFPIIAQIAMETSMMRLDLYYYYGNQPLLFHKFPLYWAVGNAIVFYMAAVITILFQPCLRGWRMLMIPLITPLADAAFAPLVVFPSAMALNSQIPNWATQTAGVLSFVIAFMVVSIAINLLTHPSRADLQRAFQKQPT